MIIAIFRIRKRIAAIVMLILSLALKRLIGYPSNLINLNAHIMSTSHPHLLIAISLTLTNFNLPILHLKLEKYRKMA